MILLFGAFVAGLLTVLAPCVLPLLPVIIGGSVTGGQQNKYRPLIITASLAISLIVFTLLLKVTTLFINIPPVAITYFSGGIIIAVGLLMLFPLVYARLMARVGIETKSQQLLGKGFRNKGVLGAIIIGAALGPVFSSCNPVYAYILATILPANFGQAMAYIVAYVLGLSLILLLISYLGQKFVKKLNFASNPKGWFQRAIAIIFIIVGLLVVTGYDKRLQTWISENTPFNFDALSSQLIPDGRNSPQNNELFNIEPYDAPELTGLQEWINSDPQTLESLRGKVVLIDFWTYSCINCVRSVPYVQGWYDNYKNSGFAVLGMHAPEFAFERVPENVKKAAREQNITYPIALDNSFATWNAFENQYWPAHYLIDKDGKVRRVHFGEGEYNKTEQAIRELLKETGASLPSSMTTTGDEQVPSSQQETAETYLGTKRGSNYSGSPALGTANQSTFTPVEDANLESNQWTLSGNWEVTPEKIIARGQSTLRFKVNAKDVYVVASAPLPAAVKIWLNDAPIEQSNASGKDVRKSSLSVQSARLYHIAAFPEFTKDSVIMFSVPEGVELNVFTFGS